jgi:hypothetical protein
MPSRALLSATILALALNTAAATAATPVKRRLCTVHHARTLATVGTTRLLSRDTNIGDEYGPTTTLYGCVGRHSPRNLGEAYGIEPATLRITPRYAAFSFRSSDVACSKYMPNDPACTTTGIRVFDLLTGRLRASAASEAQALVLSPRGRTAWVGFPGADGRRSVVAIDAAGQRTLATGVIDPASLVLVGETVTFSVDGVSQSATLA